MPSAVRSRCANDENATAPSVTTPNASNGCFGSRPRVSQTTPSISQPGRDGDRPRRAPSRPAPRRTALARPTRARPEIGPDHQEHRDAEHPQRDREEQRREPAAVEGRPGCRRSSRRRPARTAPARPAPARPRVGVGIRSVPCSSWVASVREPASSVPSPAFRSSAPSARSCTPDASVPGAAAQLVGPGRPRCRCRRRARRAPDSAAAQALGPGSSAPEATSCAPSFRPVEVAARLLGPGGRGRPRTAPAGWPGAPVRRRRGRRAAIVVGPARRPPRRAAWPAGTPGRRRAPGCPSASASSASSTVPRSLLIDDVLAGRGLREVVEGVRDALRLAARSSGRSRAATFSTGWAWSFSCCVPSATCVGAAGQLRRPRCAGVSMPLDEVPEPACAASQPARQLAGAVAQVVGAVGRGTSPRRPASPSRRPR